MKQIVFAALLAAGLAAPALAQSASPAPAMKGDHMSGAMKGDHMKGTHTKGDRMKGAAMKGDHMKGGAMKGDHMSATPAPK